MAQNRIGTASQDGRHPAAPSVQAWVSDRVNAAMGSVQARPRHHLLDSPAAEAQLQELPPGDHAVLESGQRRNLRVPRH